MVFTMMMMEWMMELMMTRILFCVKSNCIDDWKLLAGDATSTKIDIV